MERRRSVVVTLLLVLGLISLLGAVPDTCFSKEPYKIGGAFAITGPSSFLGDPERYKLIRGHSIESRFWFTCASALAAWLIYLIASGAPLGACATSLSFGFSASVLGVTKSYRAWQVETGNIFLPQSLFWHFFKNERWVR